MITIKYVNVEGEITEEKFETQTAAVNFLNTLNYLDCKIISYKVKNDKNNGA